MGVGGRPFGGRSAGRGANLLLPRPPARRNLTRGQSTLFPICPRIFADSLPVLDVPPVALVGNVNVCAGTVNDVQPLSLPSPFPPMSGHDSQSGTTQWTEPPWSGWIETTGDALLILEAARRGLIPRVTRRLVDSERKMITYGSVFVFDEDESGIKRWTDGFFWSPSRILGNFLLYRETEKRGAGHRSARVDAAAPAEEADGVKQEGQTLSRPKSESNRLGIDRQRERILVGSLTNSYKFKPGGMMKKVRILLLFVCLHPPPPPLCLSVRVGRCVSGPARHRARAGSAAISVVRCPRILRIPSCQHGATKPLHHIPVALTTTGRPNTLLGTAYWQVWTLHARIDRCGTR